MAKALVRFETPRSVGGVVYLGYTALTDDGKSWSGGVPIDFALRAKAKTDMETNVISQAADRGVTLVATDIAISGLPV